MAVVNTSPVLWGDPLWAALTRAQTALEDNPAILKEKKPEWEDGLNSETINGLCAEAGLGEGVVFELDDERDGDQVVNRFVIVNHPGPPEPIQVTTWSRYGARISNSKVARVLVYLQAWKDARQQALMDNSSMEASGGVLAVLEGAVPPLDKSNGQWVKVSLAAKLSGVEAGTLAKYRSTGSKNSDSTFGQDDAGRVWRRSGTPLSHPWYWKKSLRN